ncbi:MAG: hypothetical protein ACHQ5A_08625 [Opitutales bacterium]
MVSGRMRLLTFSLRWCGLAAAAAVLSAAEPAVGTEGPAEADPLAGVPAPLAEAIRKFGQNAEHWACTQHEVTTNKAGRVTEDRLVRYDPSLPYDRQWTLLKKNGRDATARQVQAFRRDKEKHLQDRKTLGELLEVAKGRLVADTLDGLTYEVPLSPQDNDRLPPDKFEVLIRVSRQAQAFESIEVRLREPLRVAVIGKVNRAGAVLTFTQVDPRYPPAITSGRGFGSGSILFVPVSVSYEITRTDFQRVKPWSDRFVVRPGPIKYLDF